MTPIPKSRIVLFTPLRKEGTASIATPIRSIITPRYLNKLFMVTKYLINYFFSTANKAIINRLQKYFAEKNSNLLKLIEKKIEEVAKSGKELFNDESKIKRIYLKQVCLLTSLVVTSFFCHISRLKTSAFWNTGDPCLFVFTLSL
jgi:hypothetical protein